MTLLDQIFSLAGAIAFVAGFLLGFAADQITAHLGRNRRS